MKKVVTVLTIILLTGCTDARGIALQDQYCSDKGGVFEYVTETAGLFVGYCADNTSYKWDTIRNLKLQPEFYPTKGE